MAESNSRPRPLFCPFLLGEGARDKLQDNLIEYKDLFMKNKADIGRCKIAKHRIENQRRCLTKKVPGAYPWTQ